MAKVSETQDRDGWPSIEYRCPGCGARHVLRLRSTGAPEPTFTWNGFWDEPTIHQAVKTEHCHHVVQGGRIRFMSSSKHRLVCETVEMEEVRALS